MPLSSEHQLIFIHIPKNAGSSIEEALSIRASPKTLLSRSYMPDEIYALQHLPFDDLKRVVSPEQWLNYRKFAVVRNPWDRIVSDWHWRRRGGLPLGHMSFPEFVKYVTDTISDPDWGRKFKKADFQTSYMGHFKPQVAYVGTSKDEVRVLRFERLSREWPRYCMDVIGRELPLPLTNDSARGKKHYSEEYEGNEELINAVRVAYKDDIERFGYEFFEPASSKSFNGLLAKFKSKKRKPEDDDGNTKTKSKPPSSSSSSATSSTSTPSSEKAAAEDQQPNVK